MKKKKGGELKTEDEKEKSYTVNLVKLEEWSE